LKEMHGPLVSPASTGEAMDVWLEIALLLQPLDVISLRKASSKKSFTTHNRF
jgi:hypothetical protein